MTFVQKTCQSNKRVLLPHLSNLPTQHLYTAHITVYITLYSEGFQLPVLQN